jgi:biopolymer transport protein ExbD
MRRFSQRNQLVTLSEINITPLLDLAFVLLIIFIITTPLLEQSLNLKLPVAASSTKTTDIDDVVTVEATSVGTYRFKGKRVGSEAELERDLLAAYQANRELIVRIRVDRDAKAQPLVTIMDICKRHNITKFQIATDTAKHQ